MLNTGAARLSQRRERGNVGRYYGDVIYTEDDANLYVDTLILCGRVHGSSPAKIFSQSLFLAHNVGLIRDRVTQSTIGEVESRSGIRSDTVALRKFNQMRAALGTCLGESYASSPVSTSQR
jgi:hypothetical protein